MGRGATLGRRRKRRRRKGGRGPGPAPSPERLKALRAERLDAQLAARPRWVTWIWATPPRRLLLSAVFISLAVWVVVGAITGDGLLGREGSVAALAFAPAVLVLFGLTGGEAVRDAIAGANRAPSVYRLDEFLFHDRRGRVVLGAYGVFVVVGLVLLWT